MRDYSEIGLNEYLQNKNSPATRPPKLTGLDVEDKFIATAVSPYNLDRDKIFKLSNLDVVGTFTIATNTTLSINLTAEVTRLREIRPMLSLADLYITTKNDTHIWNSVNLDGDLTVDESAVDFWVVFGKRENELDPNVVGVTYQITNWGTATHTYFLDDRIAYVPIK